MANGGLDGLGMRGSETGGQAQEMFSEGRSKAAGYKMSRGILTDKPQGLRHLLV